MDTYFILNKKSINFDLINHNLFKTILSLLRSKLERNAEDYYPCFDIKKHK